MPVIRCIWAAPVTVALAVSMAGCGQEEVKYEPKAAPSGAKANMPEVPNIAKKPIKKGDAYTVWGVAYYLRNRVHTDEVSAKQLKIRGWITKTNLPDAPECAVHEGGKGDPEGCVAPVPTFWIGDTKDAKENETIKVMGWASNYARIYDAIEQYEEEEDKKKEDQEDVLDAIYGVNLPRPLPNVGAEVTVDGNYSSTFTKSTKGTESDPIMGILTYNEMEYHAEPPEKATLPGMD